MNGRLNARAKLLLLCALFCLSAFFLANTFAVLTAARHLNDIGNQCALMAAGQNDLAGARKAAEKVLAAHKPDGFLLREPCTCDLVFYTPKPAKNDKTTVPAPFVTVKTSVQAWIPAPQLFYARALPGSGSENLVRFSALHSYPCLPLYDEAEKQNGRSSI